MNFYLLSKAQKQDINSNRNIVNYKENELYKYVENKSKNKGIYYSNSILKKRQIKKNKTINFNDFTEFNHKKEKKKKLQSFKSKASLADNKLNKRMENILDKEYPIFNETMYNKKKYIKKIFYYKNEDSIINIFNGLFSKFYILGKKQNKYMNYKNKKKSLLHHLNKNMLLNINNDYTKPNINTNNLNILSIQNTNNSKNHKFKSRNIYSIISHSNNNNKNVINSKII
jgi:hypothetical protein